MPRRHILVLLLLAWAFTVLVWHMQTTLERTVQCEIFGSPEACCENNNCSRYAPAGTSRPAR